MASLKDHSEDRSSWLFSRDELENSPSRVNSITSAQELQYRTSTCTFIWHLGQKCSYPLFAIATGMVFFHRFFIKNSFSAYEQSVVGATCLFLAGKVEECPKKLKDVVQAYHQLRNKSTQPLLEQSKEFFELKECILIHERIVLNMLSFDISVTHPYKFLMSMVQTIDAVVRRAESQSGKAEVSDAGRQLCDVAWSFTNDSLRTTLSLQYPAEFIAMGAISLALKLRKWKTVLPSGNWVSLISSEFKVTGMSDQVLRDICSQILDFYERMKHPAVPPPALPPRPPVVPQAATSGTPTGAKPVVNPNGCPQKGTRWEEGKTYYMQGSVPQPYELMKKGQVYSCSCSAWRYFPHKEEKRTCKHLRTARGETAERGRVGADAIAKSDEMMRRATTQMPQRVDKRKGEGPPNSDAKRAR
eukprot:CAMPEP_0116999038 /NCGR_PEP_ID=MMETSP0472-20121206/1899_1 /TAXON_ID=693140 ORGANISM="Tiarina fusus, Strain LIS" /NCGR_SAMPLE_ID=MMETSP0472 /ASSEMBLY_ACC=CAM_ASM_000603 /LENGTH=414 /DNA_ID=CAMNT_0004698369 /DNA_START=106 /DNA_END=1350 /DNA_ORIENTATION=-